MLGKCVLRYCRTKKWPSKVEKQEVQKVEKLRFFKRVSPCFWPKIGIFPNFYSREYRLGKCVL